MTANVNHVITHLRNMTASGGDEAELVGDERLNELLDPVRSRYPLPKRCEAKKCGRTLAYWALHSSGARIAPGPERVERKANQAGTYLAEAGNRIDLEPDYKETIVGGVIDLRFPGLEFQHRFEEPVEWALSGLGAISLETNPTVGSPWPLRWGFRCPRCGAVRKYRNSEMLSQFLDALSKGQKAISAARLY